MEFSAVHFLIRHEKCSRLHGHNWNLSTSIEGIPGKGGMMIDFSVLKKILRKIIGKYDHKVLIAEKNEDIKFNKNSNEKEMDFEIDNSRYILPAEDCILLPLENTTCEELTMMFRKEIYEAIKLEKFKLKSLEVFIEEKDGQGVRYNG